MIERRLGLPLWHPAALIATGGGLGLLPLMPGTWGALAALPCAWAISALAGGAALAAAAILAFALGCWATADEDQTAMANKTSTSLRITSPLGGRILGTFQ